MNVEMRLFQDATCFSIKALIFSKSNNSWFEFSSLGFTSQATPPIKVSANDEAIFQTDIYGLIKGQIISVHFNIIDFQLYII